MDELINFFMDPLRLTLIVAGVVVLLAIIIFSRKSSKRDDFIYSSPSSKEFSFGSQGKAGISDALANEMLVDEEVIVLPRKQKESEVEVAEGRETMANRGERGERDEIASPASFADRSHSNSYKINTESEKPAISEFRAFQSTDADERAGSDIFEDDIIASPKPFVAHKFEVVKEKEPEEVPQFQRFEVPADTNVEEKAELRTEARAGSKSENKPQNKPQNKSENKPENKSPNKSAKEMFVVLHVIAVEGSPFNGLDILDATKTLGLAFGKHSIFHYPMSAAPAGDSKFCLVNMSATGNFETSKISTLETNGVSLIMRLPIRGADAQTVFSNMVGVAQALARKLGGEILDQTRIPLTPQIVESIRADISHFENSLKHATSKESVPEI